VAKEGALAASKPGVQGRERDCELEASKAEVARLSETVKEMPVKLTLVEGKHCDGPVRRWSCPSAGRTAGTADARSAGCSTASPAASRCTVCYRRRRPRS
jgi:hypothetical protein